MADVRAGIDGLAAEDRSDWSGPARTQRVLELLEASERLQAEMLRTLGEWDTAHAWADDGALSAASWLAHRAPLSKARANRLVRTARLARKHDGTGEALAAGTVSAAHVEVLATVVKGRERVFARDEHTLLDIAPTLSVDDSATAAKHWRSAADDELSRIDALHAFEMRSASMHATFGGRLELRGSFDAEGGATVWAAMREYDQPDPLEGAPLPQGTSGQRMADALVRICDEAISRRERVGRRTATVDVVIDVDTLVGSPPSEPRAMRCEIDGIGAVPPIVAQRLACDAAVGRVVMKGESEVLDLGRRTRVASRALRRAVVLRDRHCSFPGCFAPPDWCDVHHCTHWLEGGETSVTNCVLLCRRHHVACHEGGWRLARGPDGSVEVVRRGGTMRLRSPP